jgi:hypothetical protein
MRVIVFSTGTRDCEKLWRSLQPEHNVRVVLYDSPEINILNIVSTEKPSFVVYIGTTADDFPYSGVRVPTPEQLAEVSRISPMVHLCSDAADPPWWDKLSQYAQAGSFALQVAIDGVKDTPHVGMVALTPVDPGQFTPRPWESRDVPCGFAGGGGRRTETVRRIRECGGTVHWENEGGDISYDAYREFLPRCKLVLNDARTGSGEKRHVKGRVIEAGLAGCVLMEPRDSPLRDWFVPGEDFLEWGTPEEAADIIKRGDYDPAIATRFREKVLKGHSSHVFWGQVLGRITVLGNVDI